MENVGLSGAEREFLAAAGTWGEFVLGSVGEANEQRDAERLSDANLWRSWLSGHSCSFDALVDRYYARLQLYLRRHVGDDSAAEDLVQETFIRLHRMGRRVRASPSLQPLLFSIATNLARDHLRRVRRENDLQRAAREEAERLETIREAEPRGAGVLAERIWVAVRRLPATQREVFLLARLEGMSGVEVARVVGCSHATARKRVSRALSFLRKEVGPWLEETE